MNRTERLKYYVISFIFICTIVLLLRPFIVSQLIKRAEGYIGFNMYKDAVREYKKALILDNDNVRAMNWMGYAYRGMGETEKAIGIYKSAIKVDPQNIIAYSELGTIYARREDFKLSKEYLLKAVSVTEEQSKEVDEDFHFYRSGSLTMLSLCHEKLGEIEDAIEINKRILKYYPENELAKERLKRLSQ